MKMPHTPGPWAVEVPIQQPTPSESDLPMIVNAGGGIIARVRACANPRVTFNSPSLPDVGDIPEYRDGWAVGFAVAQTNGKILGMALEMAEAIVEWVDILEECGGSQAVEGSSPRDLMRLAAKIRKIKGVP